MRPVKILLRRKKQGRSRTVKVFANVRNDQSYPKQLHLGYVCVDDSLEAAKERLFNALVEKWPRRLKPKAIDWTDAEAKLAKLRRALSERALSERILSPLDEGPLDAPAEPVPMGPASFNVPPPAAVDSGSDPGPGAEPGPAPFDAPPPIAVPKQDAFGSGSDPGSWTEPGPASLNASPPAAATERRALDPGPGAEPGPVSFDAQPPAAAPGQGTFGSGSDPGPGAESGLTSFKAPPPAAASFDASHDATLDDAFPGTVATRTVLQAAPDKSSFLEIVGPHAAVLRRMAQRLTGNGALADDLIQETLVRAWSHLPRLDGEINVRAWLTTVLTRVFYDHLKRARVADKAKDTILNAYEHDEAVTLPTVSNDLLTVSNDEVLRAVQQLDAPLQEVVMCCYFESMSYRQAAEHLGVPVGTIGTRLNRARQRLKEILRGNGAGV
jgi:RNA polymerase sigma-70 factor (ECF subfamily)